MKHQLICYLCGDTHDDMSAFLPVCRCGGSYKTEIIDDEEEGEEE